MPAFKYALEERINANIRLMYNRLRKVSTKTISHEDFISLFVPREHRDMYRTMARLSNTGYHSKTYKWGAPNLRFSLIERAGKYAPPVPRTMILQDDAPEDLVASITAWAANGGDASGDFGRVSKLFSTLNETLTRSELRFVWPSIVAICNADINNEPAKQIGASLLDVRAPSGVVSLPPGLRAACRKTAETIAMVGLIPHDIQEPVEGEVTIAGVAGGQYNEPDLGIFAGLT